MDLHRGHVNKTYPLSSTSCTVLLVSLKLKQRLTLMPNWPGKKSWSLIINHFTNTSRAWEYGNKVRYILLGTIWTRNSYYVSFVTGVISKVFLVSQLILWQFLFNYSTADCYFFSKITKTKQIDSQIIDQKLMRGWVANITMYCHQICC